MHQCDDEDEKDQDDLLPRLAGLTITSAPLAIIWEPGSSLPGSTPEGNYYLILKDLTRQFRSNDVYMLLSSPNDF